MVAPGRGYSRGCPFSLLISTLVVVAAAVSSFSAAAARAPVARQSLAVNRHLKRLNKTPVKSIESPDGDIIDCVHISHQPAFDHPFLKNHTIQMRPAYHPERLYDENTVKPNPNELPTQLWHLNGRCPENTVPIRRTKRVDVLRASSVQRFGRKKHRVIPQPRSGDPDLINESGHQKETSTMEQERPLTSGIQRSKVLMSSASHSYGFWEVHLVKI